MTHLDGHEDQQRWKVCTTPTTWWDLIGAAEGIFSNGLGCSSPYTDASVSWEPLALCHATHPYPPYQSGEVDDTCILTCSDLEKLLVYVLQSLQDFGLLPLCIMGVFESLCQDLFLLGKVLRALSLLEVHKTLSSDCNCCNFQSFTNLHFGHVIFTNLDILSRPNLIDSFL
jgi:hypothetical protein